VILPALGLVWLVVSLLVVWAACAAASAGDAALVD
jgi:hypothetical protein